MDESLWSIAKPREEAARLASQLGIPRPIAQVLVNREITEPEAAHKFLYGSTEHLHNPYLMSGMKEAVDRIEKAIIRNEKIIIFGDYDADGVLSVVMLSKALATMGASVDYFIPERLKEGYGLKDEHIALVAGRGANLVISVDCGIKAVGFVQKAKEMGVDVIVTDHHLPGAELPPALAILNPLLADSTYPDRHLAGVGVVFKLIQALFEKSGKASTLRHYLKLVSIGTISDVAKLKGENRIFVRQGLKELEDVRNIGLKNLMAVCGLEGKKISEGDVGFRIGPRINAAGRMGMTELAVRLFFSPSAEETAGIARRLDDLNSKRQATEEKIYKQAREHVERKGLDKIYKILILGCEEWHRGIIGIVASRLKEAFCRPAILFSYEDGKAFGSGRSISGFSLINCLNDCKKFFLTYGGHELAAGCTLSRDDLPGFKQAANAVASSQIKDDQIKRWIKIDSALDFSDITGSFLDYFSLLSPFGVENPQPVFMTRDAEIINPPQRLKGRHVKLSLRQGGRIFEAVGWEKVGWADDVHKDDRVDLAYTFQFSTYLGEEKLSLALEGLRM